VPVGRVSGKAAFDAHAGFPSWIPLTECHAGSGLDHRGITAGARNPFHTNYWV
jgi:hypothetical protein